MDFKVFLWAVLVEKYLYCDTKIKTPNESATPKLKER